MAYRQINGRWVISIGEETQNDVIDKVYVFYTGVFKLFLPLRETDKLKQCGWQLKQTPDELVQDYFEQLLRERTSTFQ